MWLFIGQPLSFNPRPREEGDPKKLPKKWSMICFNPRPREEGDAVQ